jgi:hypothetical protein
MNVEFSCNFAKNAKKIKLYKNSYSGGQVVPCEQTDGHDVANSRFFHNFATAPKNATVETVETSYKRTHH